MSIFIRTIWNAIAYLFLLGLIIVLFFGFATDSKELTDFKVNGQVTKATIVNFRADKPNSYAAKYYVEYSFLSNSQTYNTIYGINSTQKNHKHEMDRSWAMRKIGDQFDVIYYKPDPKKNKPVADISYIKIAVLITAVSLAIASIGLLLKAVKIDERYLIVPLIIAALTFDIYLICKIMSEVIPEEYTALLLLGLAIQIAIIYRRIPLLKGWKSAIATIEPYDIEKTAKQTISTGFTRATIYDYIPIAHNPMAKPFICVIGLTYKRVYVYDYKDQYGNLHHGKTYIPLLFEKYNLGDKIKVVYNPKNPSIHYPLGKIA